MIKQHENVVLSPFRLFLEDSKVMYLNNGTVQTCHIWMIILRQKLLDDQARNQDFMWGGGGVLTRPKWTKLPKCIFYCLIRLFREVAIHEKL